VSVSVSPGAGVGVVSVSVSVSVSPGAGVVSVSVSVSVSPGAGVGVVVVSGSRAAKTAAATRSGSFCKFANVYPSASNWLIASVNSANVKSSAPPIKERMMKLICIWRRPSRISCEPTVVAKADNLSSIATALPLPKSG